jgi:large subunit ribosomal protein L5
MEKLKEQFNKVILPELRKQLDVKNPFEAPRIEKVIISAGVGDFKENKSSIEKIATEIGRIAGQKAKINLSRKAVSAFKLRIGQPVGLTVTLRGERMYDFISRLINIALPRVRDFRGLPAKSFDKQGNYSIGIKDYTIFPEVKFEEVTENFGLEVTFRIKARNQEDAKALLLKLGFPFEKNN